MDDNLESLLKKAFDNEADRPVFLKSLLDSDVYVLGKSSGATGKTIEHTLEEGSKVQIKSWKKADDSMIIPFFSSLEKLQQAIESEESYMCLNTRSLFELTLGAHLVLNPHSEVAKEFLPQEVEGLLQGFYGPKPETYVYPEETSVLLGQPALYPDKMVAQLHKFFDESKLVSAAYLIQMHDVKRDPQPTLVIGLLLSEQISVEAFRQEFGSQVGQIAYDSLLQKMPIDLLYIDVADKQGLSHYMLTETEPFYVQTQRKKGFFANLFS